jgi:hypothetical protein
MHPEMYLCHLWICEGCGLRSRGGRVAAASRSALDARSSNAPAGINRKAVLPLNFLVVAELTIFALEIFRDLLSSRGNLTLAN